MNVEKALGFPGKWRLVPEQCDYQLGRPPRSGRCRVEQDDDGMLSIAATWLSAGGERYRMTVEARTDGKPYPCRGNVLADELSFEKVSPTQLHSTTWHAGAPLQRTERELLDADTLAVRVRGRLSDGREYYNVAVYRRADD